MMDNCVNAVMERPLSYTVTHGHWLERFVVTDSLSSIKILNG
jgi:hypothetical protein